MPHHGDAGAHEDVVAVREHRAVERRHDGQPASVCAFECVCMCECVYVCICVCVCVSVCVCV